MADDMRPRLRQDTAFLQGPDRTYVRNANTAIVLKGTSAYRWLVAIGRQLDGERTVADLCGGLSAPQRETVTQLVSSLVDNGFAMVTAEEPVALDAPTGVAFASQIAFLDHHTDRPASRFAQFRYSRVLLLGGGPALTAAGRALLRNGLAELSVTAHVPELDAEVARLREHGVAAATRIVPGGAEAVAGYDAVAFCGLDDDLSAAFDLNERCVQAGVPLIPLVLVDRLAVVGPLVRKEGPCWLCGLLRLTATIDPRAAGAAWRSMAVRRAATGASRVSMTVAQMLGTTIAFELFSRLAGGLPADTVDGVVVQDIDTLESAREPLLPHPACPACPAQADPPRRREPLRGDRYERCRDLVQPNVGLLRAWADDAVPQVPIKVGVVRLAEPDLAVAGFAIDDVTAARLAAVEAAAVQYTLHIGPGRAAVSGTPNQMRRPVAPADLPTWSGVDIADPPRRWLVGRSLLSGEARHVPVGAVYPAAGSGFEDTTAGWGAGATVDEAAMAGLVGALGYTVLLDLLRGRVGTVPLVPDDVAATGGEAAFLIRAADAGALTLVEAVHDSAVHLVLARTGDRDDWLTGVGRSTVDAATRALAELLGRRQLGDAAQPRPMLLAGLSACAELVRAEPARSRLRAAPLDDDDLLAEVRAAGRDAIFVETTTVDLHNHGAMRTGRVVLAANR
jgi:bacteriocin biosynthesis cyclodehydratase domain-containing protein